MSFNNGNNHIRMLMIDNQHIISNIHNNNEPLFIIIIMLYLSSKYNYLFILICFYYIL